MLTLYAQPGETVEAPLDGAPPGLAGTLTVRVIDPTDGAEVVAETAAGIVERYAGGYVATFDAPGESAAYLIVWRDPNDGTETADYLIVNPAGAPEVEPPPPGDASAPRGARIAQGRRALLVLQLTDLQGTALEDAIGDVPVTVTRDDGSPVSNGIALHPSIGRYEHVLTPADTAQLDRLRVEWAPVRAGGVGAELHVDHYDVVGQHWFEVDSLRALDPLQDAERYSVERLVAVRDAASEYLERATGVAWVPRYGRERLTGYGSRYLALENVRIRRLVAVTFTYAESDPQVLDVAQLAGVHLQPGGALYRPTGWPENRSIDIAYEHGHDAPPPDGVRAAQLLARRTAIATYGEHAIDDRARGIQTDVGTIDLVVASAGVATDVPEVNAWIARAAER